jgi:D-beta-D-heptose 7-phosphate kinase/D-beta-D-heptose 1-phosphate adenosyltransferase
VTETQGSPCSTSGKVVTLEEARKRAAAWRAEERTVAYANGCFDLLHIGHVRTLESARAHADKLVVGVNSDESARRLKGPGRPVAGEADRAGMVAALACVDLVVIFPELSSLPVIQALRPDVWVKGGDYNIGTVNQEERAFVESYGGRVALGPRLQGQSSSDMISKIKGLPESGR